MKQYEVYYRDIKDMSNHPFSKHYQEWISETFAANGSSVEFTEEKIIISSPNMTKLCMSIMFIGYAFGQQDNGR